MSQTAPVLTNRGELHVTQVMNPLAQWVRSSVKAMPDCRFTGSRKFMLNDQVYSVTVAIEPDVNVATYVVTAEFSCLSQLGADISFLDHEARGALKQRLVIMAVCDANGQSEWKEDTTRSIQGKNLIGCYVTVPIN